MSRYVDQSALLRETGPTVRPLQGLPPNKHGSSAALPLGATNITLIDARTESNDAEVITVSMGVEVNSPLPKALLVGETIDLSARITWGMGGANFQATIDIVDGVVFSLPANYIRVDASHGGTAGAGGSTLFQASAGIAYGTFIANNGIGPQRTNTLGALLNGAVSPQVVIPRFATSFTFFGTTGALPPAVGTIITEFNSAGAILGQYRADSFSNSANLIQSFPIINGTSFIVATNTTGADFTNCGFIFGLTF